MAAWRTYEHDPRTALLEAVSMHLECFVLFRRECTRVDAIDRLWRACLWRKPWREAPALALSENNAVGPTDALETVSERYTLLRISRLPSELIYMVREYSKSARFWGFVAVLDLAMKFNAVEPTRLVSVPLGRVAAWDRGALPSLSDGQLVGLPVTRLTIDSRGVKLVERLPAGRDRYGCKKFDNMVFIITDDVEIDGVMVLFKVINVMLNSKLVSVHITWD